MDRNNVVATNPPGRGKRPTLECGPLDRKLTALKLLSKRHGFGHTRQGVFGIAFKRRQRLRKPHATLNGPSFKIRTTGL